MQNKDTKSTVFFYYAVPENIKTRTEIVIARQLGYLLMR
jgi:hypothetical protein